MPEITWSRTKMSNRPGAKRGCTGCGVQFKNNEEFAVKETKVNRFRGDDEVEFLCFNCISDQERNEIKLWICLYCKKNVYHRDKLGKHRC